MVVKRIVITKLFGLFDHDVRLNTQERITLIHGPNGVGKTSILKLVNDLFNQRFRTLTRVPFTRLAITFSDRSKLTVHRRPTPKARREYELAFTYRKSGKEQVHSLNPAALRERASRARYYRHLDELVPHVQRVGPELWHDRRTDEQLSFGDVVDRYGDILPPGFARGRAGSPKWLQTVLGSTFTHFIQTQRLFATPAPDPAASSRRVQLSQTTVETYAEEMTGQIQEKLRESGDLAASLDRTFPNRLMHGTLPKEATEKRIRSDYKRQTEYRRRLMKAGLINPEEQVPLPAGKIGDSDRKVLWYYLSDVDEKFRAFDTLLKRVELFSNIINTRFLYKNFEIDRERGFRFTAEDSSNVPLTALSSGEQHELVLAFELLFKVQERSLILIDEPELSLHVTWQHKFLEDIERISELANLDFLIATHSPSIIHHRRDLMVALAEA